ncbi:hypothetical protein QQ045_014287 [Rhodiola kirilowii]
MLEFPEAVEHIDNRLVLCWDESANEQQHHGCYLDSVPESYRELPFRVNYPIMSRILSTGMSMIDRTSSKTSISKYGAHSSKDLSLHSELTCFESCFNDRSEDGNESTFFNYLEKNYS